MMTKYFETSLHGIPLVVRDIEPADVDSIINYWHNGDREYWESIGVDVRKIVSVEKTRATFMKSLPDRRTPSDRITIVAAIPSGIIAYTNVNLESDTVGYAHVHVIEPKFRSKGVAALLFTPTIRIFFQIFGLEKIYFQTSIENKRINSMLRRRGLNPIRELDVRDPDGMALPGKFYLYEIDEHILDNLASQPKTVHSNHTETA